MGNTNSNGTLQPWPVLAFSFAKDWLNGSEVALKCGTIALTYNDLFARAKALQDILVNTRNIKSSSRILLAFDDADQSWISFCVFQLATALIGACFTVMDTRSKSMNDEARGHVISLFKPDLFVIIGDVQVAHPLLPPETRIDWETINSYSSEVLELNCEAELSSGAFIDWTSGSTGGLPKGCVCSFGTLSNMYYQKWSLKEGFMDPTKLPVVGFNLFFLWYWWQPLCHGGTSVIFTDAELRDVSLFTSVVECNSIDAIDCLTPSLLKVLCAHFAGTRFPSSILVSGEPLYLDLCRDYSKRFPGHRLVNVFSTTETGDAGVTDVTSDLLEKLANICDLTSCPIERALHGAELVLRPLEDESDEFAELIVAGVGAKEYIGDSFATAKGFSDKGWMSRDRVRKLPEGMIEITGRLDDCVKVRGFKIDLKAIEDATKSLDGVADAVSIPDEESIYLFVVRSDISITEHMIRDWIGPKLSTSHMPQVVACVGSFPLTRTGKVDKKALLTSYNRSAVSAAPLRELPDTTLGRVMKAFREVACKPVVADEESTSFWARGGTSLMAISVCHILKIPVKLLLEASEGSPKDLARLIDELSVQVHVTTQPQPCAMTGGGVAIVGMSGRWPGVSGAMTSTELFKFLLESRVPLTPAPDVFGSGNVGKGFYLDEPLVKGFDMEFWKDSLNQSSASKIDPHQRIFLELAVEALTDAGVVNTSSVKCGVFVSSGSLSHFIDELVDQHSESLTQIRETDPARYLQLELGCDKDYLSLRVAKLLGLTGPAVTVQAACASALVAITQAVAAIKSGQCEIAVTGGISLVLPQVSHAAAPGLIWSQDGACRPFDAKASGTANCNGGHCFVLKYLQAARRDNDAIYAIISGAAFCNDGNRGRDFVAPSVSGHQEAIGLALGQANRLPSEVTMIEAHGTGTIVGDPVEYSALAEAYRPSGSGPIISLGSVKGNVGHANTAAGALGLAKAALSVFSGTLFKSGSFQVLNPHITPVDALRVQSETSSWTALTRIAGVSSLGMGGTNCHVIVEQASSGEDPQDLLPSVDGQEYSHPLLLSGHSAESVKILSLEFKNFFETSTVSPEDVASTLAHHRPVFPYRRTITSAGQLEHSFAATRSLKNPKMIVLLFPGQGGVFPGAFKVNPEITRILGFDLFVEYSESKDPVLSQLALFAVGYTSGVTVLETLPSGVEVVCCGHSLGEYTAAAVCRMISLEDALALVQKRAELLVKHTASGSMAAVSATVEEIENVIAKNPEFENVEIACINKINRITISGPKSSVTTFIEKSGISARLLPTSGAFHSALTEPVMQEISKFIDEREIIFSSPKPSMRLVSTFTGGFVEAVSRDHFVNHTRNPVRMVDCANLMAKSFTADHCAFLDVGPGSAMAKMAYIEGDTGRVIKSVIPCKDGQETVFSSNSVKGLLWECGYLSTADVVPKFSRRRVLGLPTIGWNRTMCWPQPHKKRVYKIENISTDVSKMAYEEVWLAVTDCMYRPETEIRQPFFVNPEKEQIFDLTEPLIWEGRPVVALFYEYRALTCDSPDLGTIQSKITLMAVSLLQAAIRAREQDRFVRCRIVLVVPDSVAYGGLLGAVRCAINEDPDLNITLLRGVSDTVPLEIYSVLSGEYRFDNKKLVVRRISRVTKFETPSTFPLPQQGVFVVTGGLGGIGSALINFLLRTANAKNIIVLSRRDASPADFGWSPDVVSIVSVDLASTDSVRSGINSILDKSAVIDCAFHLAGSVKDGLVAHVSTDLFEFLSDNGGKIVGAVSLMHALPKSVPIVLFSSTSALLGSPGQCLYAAANSALDAIACARNSRKIYSIQWGGWDASVKNSMSAKFGLMPLEGCERFLSESQGMDAFVRCMARGECVTAVADIFDWSLYSEKADVTECLVAPLLPHPEQLPGWVIKAPQTYHDPQLKWIMDHVDGSDEPLIPATGLLGCMVSSLGTESVNLKSVKFWEPLRLGRRISVKKAGDALTIESASAVHASATVVSGAADTPSFVKLMMNRVSKETMTDSRNVAEMYNSLAKGGFAYGPSFRLVTHAMSDTSNRLIVARIVDHPTRCLSDKTVYWENSRALDACTHVASLLNPSASSAFPSAIGAVNIGPSTDTFAALTNLFEGIQSDVEAEIWYVAMRQSPLSAGEFASDVSVDLVAVSRNTTVCLDRLILTPVDNLSTEEATTVLEICNEIVKPCAAGKGESVSGSMDVPFRILISGELKTAVFPLQLTPPEPDQVQIITQVYGLSFLDVLAATGVMPEPLLGGEFSGTVSAVGETVSSKFSVGDRVLAVCPGGMQSHMNMHADLVSRIPDELSFSSAATIPVSAGTALFAIERARIESGHRVLVHNASGALGMALISVLTKEFGTSIDIVATCSQNAAKRALVASLGVQTIIDSRDFATWPANLEATVDVSLGAMHPDLMIATLTLIKSFGTVVDVGKRLQTDGAGEVNLFAPFVRGLTYTTAHLDELMRVHPAKVGRILERAVALGVTLPLKMFRLGDIDDALSFLSSGKHTGKVVVEMPPVSLRDNLMGPRIDVQMDGLDNSFELQREISRIFPDVSEVTVKNLDWKVDFHQCQQRSVWIDSSFSSKSLLSALRRIHAPVSGHLVVVSPAKLVGEDPVPQAFREIRKNALSTLSGSGNVKGSESAWIQTTIASMIGKPKLGDIELSSSLEQLGIDSLGRLQLRNAFKRQFPHSRLNQFGSTVSISQIFSKDHSAEKSIEPTRKWLALHGFRTSPEVLQHQLAEFIDMFLSDAKVDFIQAPHAARGPCPHGGEGFEWWSAVEDDSYEGGWIGDVGIDESIEILRQRIASTGPYEGVVGFSQGAGMAHHLVVVGLVTKAILFSPVAPRGRSWHTSLQDSSASVIVLWDPSDKSVAGYPIDGLALVLHSQGHAIPHIKEDAEAYLRKWLS